MDVDSLKMQMDETSKHEDWSGRLTRAGNDKQQLQNALSSVLLALTVALMDTALQKRVLAPSLPQVRDLVRSLDDGEVEEWKNAIQRGDWVRLSTHRTYPVRFQMIDISVIWYRHSETSQI